jgi:acyl-coenzyme A synthetase/AMP-(fatty) acid ligase/acyl carrier protein
VSVCHRNIVRLIKGNNPAPITSSDVLLQLAPLAFDASTFEIWGALLNGARLVLYPHGRDLSPLKALLAQEQVSVLWLTAGLFHQMVEEHVESFSSLRMLLAGGDALSAPHVRQVLERLPQCQLINGYGPTECTTFSAWQVVKTLDARATNVPIGKPLSNTSCYVLDENAECVPIGVIGELYIGGAGVARGYLNRAALTAERFIPDPFSESGERLYRTGDLVRWSAAGELEFVSRVDHQVKIRGFRIEPGEIEAALLSHAGVGEAAVLAREDVPGEKRLVAYCVPVVSSVADESQASGLAQASNALLPTTELRAYLAQRLPDYMIPAAFVMLEKFPLTANGKVDRNALPIPEARSEASLYIAPRNAEEATLAQIWSEVLRVERVGIHDNFFELGGDSLRAMRVIARMRELLRLELPLRELFESPTIAELAARGEEIHRSGEHKPELPPLTARRKRTAGSR